jgi:predicted dienelactone hydrolase
MKRAGTIFAALVLGSACLGNRPASADAAAERCLNGSGDAGRRCLKQYAAVLERCRGRADAACEDAAAAPGGDLEDRLARTESPILRRCGDASAETLGYVGGVGDVVARVPQACVDFAADLLDIGFADDPPALSSDELACQRSVARRLADVRKSVVQEFGPRCFVRDFSGKTCDRSRRDASVDRERSRARGQIVGRCGSDFDALGLSTLSPGSTTLEERVDDVLDRVINRSRHYAQQVYPPNNLGPTADFGPFPVGVTTLALEDLSRPHADPDVTGPRPVTTEVYYPSTDAAVAGVPREVVQVLGVDVIETPAYRDVGRAAGAFPLVLFSHGNNGIRIQSFFFAAHLASHGYIVATPDHHGNTFVDGLLGIVDPASAVNRPLDMSFLIDEFLGFNTTPGNFFESAIDPARIGLSGHSFGGYTTFALAGGTFGLGTFTDARVKAILPQAPSALAFPDAFFATITIPTLILGGSIDETTPFASDQQRPFDNLAAGAPVVALAQLADAGHFTFSDFCEVPRELLGFLGGFDEACEPRHLPWRHAHDIVNFLALNFFDGVLSGSTDALDRLDPANLAAIEDLAYQSK